MIKKRQLQDFRKSMKILWDLAIVTLIFFSKLCPVWFFALTNEKTNKVHAVKRNGQLKGQKGAFFFNQMMENAEGIYLL